ncbi:MAG: leucyl/phenylalanyl-tRNA--protein transferase [Kutzneria sp.]|nr:leucyl/phenylalanyl-tRNA--protein transferase [Kutzneria sp.]
MNEGSIWDSVDWRNSPGVGPVAVGADLNPDTLISAYMNGLYPYPPIQEELDDLFEDRFGESLRDGTIRSMSPGNPDFSLTWWSRDPRAVISRHSAKAGQTLRRVIRQKGWTTTVDRCFDSVVKKCGPERGAESWLSNRMAEAFLELHRRGYAHSIEVWENENLVGGSMGVQVGGIFSWESAFFVQSHAGKVAVLDTLARMLAAGGELLDAQMMSPTAASVGAEEIGKGAYYDVLELQRTRAVRMSDAQLPAARLIEELALGHQASEPQ